MIQVKSVRVVVVQGYCLLRKALIERIERESWIEVCGSATGIEEARGLVEEHRPHVLVMNVSMKCSVGVSSFRKLKRDHAGLAILAFSCDSEFENTSVGQALRAGADGYVSAEDSLEDFVHAIRSVKEEKPYVSRHVKWGRCRLQAHLLGLSRQEAEVFCLTGCGYVTHRIADKMNVSAKTVETYRERIRGKMGLASGADLLYASTSLMRAAARRSSGGPEDEVVKELLSAKD